MLGALLGNYRIIEALGEGGMGVVYVGRHEALGRRVVVKVLRPEMSRQADMLERFFNEAQAATAINNPGIAQVFDFGTTPDGKAYFVMELLEGETLAARLRSGPLEAVECCRIGRQIANVLQAAHEAGITHRDLKPDNLFLVPDREVSGGKRVKVLDFGLAKLANEARPVRTRTGLVMGTPNYMSPEQCRGISNADARSDIYSLGCILFRMACGRTPFVSDVVGDVIVAHVQEPAPNPRKFAPDIPAELAALIKKMLAKNPTSRPQTMDAVSQAFDQILEVLGGTRTRTPPSLSPAQAPTPASPEDPPSLTLADPISMSMDDTLLGTRAAAAAAADDDVATTPHAEISVVPLPGTLLWPTGESSDMAAAFGAAEQSGVKEPARAGETSDAGEPSGAGETSGQVETSSAAEISGVPRLRTRRLPFVLAGLLVAGAAIAIVIVFADGGSSAPGRSISGGELEAPAAAPIKLVGDLEARCRVLQTEHKWTELERCADELTRLDPGRAAELRFRAMQEIKSASRVEAVEAALREDNLKRAKAELAYVWPESVEHSDIKRKYVIAESQAIGDLASELARVKDASCKKYNALLEKERNLKPVYVTAESARLTPCSPVTCDADALAQKGRVQLGAGQLDASFMSYEAAYECNPVPARARAPFTLACNLREIAKARLYWKQMAPAMRAQTLGICVRKGIAEATLNAP